MYWMVVYAYMRMHARLWHLVRSSCVRNVERACAANAVESESSIRYQGVKLAYVDNTVLVISITNACVCVCGCMENASE